MGQGPQELEIIRTPTVGWRRKRPSHSSPLLDA